MRLDRLLNILPHHETVAGDPTAVEVEEVCIDSRQAGPGRLFAAIPGEKTDPTIFVADALRSGSPAALVQTGRTSLLPQETKGLGVVVATEDVRQAAGLMAHKLAGNPSHTLRLIGITGTNGKTTVSYIVAALLEKTGIPTGIMGTVKYAFGELEEPAPLTTPDAPTIAAFLARVGQRGAKAVAMEVSSHALVQDRVAGCHFACAVFTNLSHDHLDYHQDMEAYYRAKRRLFTAYKPGVAVVNLDDPYGRRLVQEITGTRTITYGLSATDARLRASRIRFEADGTRFILTFMGERTEVFIPLVGRHNVSNFLAAAACALNLDVGLQEIAEAASLLPQIPGRLEKVATFSGISAFVDYAHTPDAVTRVLSALRELSPRRIITVLGCGGDRDKQKRPIMASAGAKGSDVLVITSDNPRNEDPLEIIGQMLQGLEGDHDCRVLVVPDRKRAIEEALALARPGDLLLVAGKGHEEYQIVGNRRLPFSDKAVVMEAVKDLDRFIGDCFNTAAVASATGGITKSDAAPKRFLAVSTDTRSISPGELFWALKGQRFDGNLFVEDALKKGAVAAVTSSRKAFEQSMEQLVLVEDDTEALAAFAARVRRRLNPLVVGVTGSCGKTTVKEILAAILSVRYHTLKTKGNLNNLIGCPLTLLELRPWHQAAVVEMGTNSPGEIARLAAMTEPDISLITCVRPAHLEGLGSLQAVAQEKLDIFRHTRRGGSLVVNLDDPLIVQGISSGDPGLEGMRLAGFSISSEMGSIDSSMFQHMVRVLEWRQAISPSGVGNTSGRVETTLELDGTAYTLRLGLFGKAAVINLAAAAAAALCAGLSPEEISKGLSMVSLPPGRLGLWSKGRLVLLDDSYNANPASMEMAIETLLATEAEGRVAVLGDMLELGDAAESYHREIGRMVAEGGIDRLISIGPLSRTMAEEARRAGMSEVLHMEDTNSFCRWLKEEGSNMLLPRQGRNAILFKASRGIGLDQAVAQVKAWYCRHENGGQDSTD